jgi:integrase
VSARKALSLMWWQVQEEARLVVFSEDTKSRKYRYVPLTEAALTAIHALGEREDSPYVFYDPLTRKRLKECRKAWELARKNVGVPELQVKDLRHDYAIRLAEAGADMHEADYPGETAERLKTGLRQGFRGGGGRIRTHGTLPGTAVFKTAALNHSATPPLWAPYTLQ